MAKFTGVARDDAGNTLASASVTVYDAGTSTLSTIYSDRAMATAETNPFNADADGAYEFHAPPAEYRVVVSKAGFTDHDEDYIVVGLANEAWAVRGDHASSHLEIEELGQNKVIRVETGLPTDALVIDANENFGFGSDGFADMVGPGIGLDAVGTAPTTNPTGKALLYIDASDDHKLKARVPSGTVYVMGSAVSTSAQEILLRPQQNEPPTTNYATIDTRNNHPVLDFNDSTNEDAIFTFYLPTAYNGGGLTVEIGYALTSATTGNIKWDVAIERIGDQQLDIDADSFAAAQDTGAVAVPGTSGNVDVVTVAFTDGAQMDSLAAGELGRIKFTRDTAVASNATGDMEFRYAVIRET